jgi:hypothetical protein
MHYKESKDPDPYNLILTDRSIRYLEDSDYYIDMNRYLATPCHTILFTLAPVKAASANMYNMAYYFDEENQINVSVSGGARYRHKLWDYNSDHLTVTDYRNGLARTLVIYRVTRLSLNPLYSIFYLQPITHIEGFINIQYFRLSTTNYHVLKQFEPVKGRFTIINSITDNAQTTSIADVGKYAEASVETSTLDSLISQRSVTKVDITTAQVIKRTDLDEGLASIVLTYIRSVSEKPPAYVFPVELAALRYQYIDKENTYDEAAKPSLIPFMTPFMHGAYAPDSSAGNDQQCVQGRVVNVRSHVNITPLHIKYVKEYLDLLVPIKHILVPSSLEDVSLRQAKATQRNIEEGCNWSMKYSSVVSGFMKKEASQNGPGDPRNITIIQGPLKYRYATIMYPVMDWLKGQHFYAFGKTPKEIAALIAEICVKSRFGVQTSDMSRFDGHVNNFLRYLELELLLALLPEEYHEEIRELHGAQYNNVGYTTFGIIYEQLFSRGSGSMETSPLNSVIGDFVAYIGYRMMGFSPKTSFEKERAIAGDDALLSDMPDCYCVDAATFVGLKVKPNFVQKGKRGVNFLSRFYTRFVWQGDLNSCCDIRRQLAKFHVTRASAVSAQTKLKEKCMSYALSDPNTPIIGAFCRHVLRKLNIRIEGMDEEATLLDEYGFRSRQSIALKSEQYPNEDCECFTDLLLEQIPDVNVDTFIEFMDKDPSLDRCLNVPLIVPLPEVALPANCVLHNHEAGEELETKVVDQEKPDPEVRKKRNRRRGGKGKKENGNTSGAAQASNKSTAPKAKNQPKAAGKK